MRSPLNIFCCYAREDLHFLEELRTHLMPLQHQGVFSIWSDTDISPGSNYVKEIIQHLDSAHIILLLVSPAFIASEYCYSKEMSRALERHKRGDARVIPIILRYSSWLETSISKLQALPTDAKPISSWLDRDEALLDVTVGIKKVVEQLVTSSTLTHQKSTVKSLQTKIREPGLEHPSRPAFFSRSPIAWCPSCINEFYIGECRIMSRKTPGKVLKSAPTGWKQLARINVEPLTSPKYLRELASRECPYCGYLLPYNIELAENICIAVIGDVSSGKSHYITSVIHQLKERWLKENSKYVSLTCLTPDEEENYRRRYLIPVFLHNVALIQNRPGRYSANGTPIGMEPFIYELRFYNPWERNDKRINIILYDGSGEDYANEVSMIEFAGHVMYADAIIFLIDPKSILEINNRLPLYLRAPFFSGRAASSIINSTIRLLDRFHGSDAKHRLRSMPVAMMLSKADLFKYTASIAPPFRFLSHSICSDHIDMHDIKAIDKEVRAILEECKERSLLRASQKFSNVSFFATSATGCAPDTAGIFPFIDPCRCLDPILWILHQHGVVSDQTQREEP